MQTAAIVIPIYKKNISENETLSLLQCFKVLGKYPIIFVCPKSLDTRFYEDLCKSNGIEFKAERFQDKFFKGLVAYSRLLLNINFYKRFENFDYILLYQLDAWVFSDDLKIWMDKGYDYIGAPWFEGWDKVDSDSEMLPIAGNGGLSLRKVSSVIKVLSCPIRYVRDWDDVFYTFGKNRLISNILNVPKLLLKRYGFGNLTYFFFKQTEIFEDMFFVKFASKLNKDFKIALPEDAMYFSFEANPSRLYEITNNTLPFGCHAWEKYEPEFWEKFITTSH